MQTRYKPRPKKWSALRIYAYLAEGEMMLRVRLRHIVAESGSGITTYSQDKCGAIGNYETIPCHQSLKMLTPVKKLKDGVLVHVAASVGLIAIFEECCMLELLSRTAKDVFLARKGKAIDLTPGVLESCQRHSSEHPG